MIYVLIVMNNRQWGDQLSTGQTHNDGFTIYYGSSLATCLVTDHVRAINALPA